MVSDIGDMGSCPGWHLVNGHTKAKIKKRNKKYIKKEINNLI